MNSISYGLLIALAIALLFAAFTDIRRRQIDNWLNLAIALAAPVFWWSQGLSLWPDVAFQLGMAAAAFAVFAALFAFKVMGGGDVKLLTALALWIPFYEYMQLLLIMAVTGGVLTMMLVFWHVARRQRDRIAVPYGVAIAVGGLWTLAINYLPAGALAAQGA
ncbi:prepilin peptidase [Erythrobacter sp. WG]|nr:prepilin peptidase [Erythrobacter sp. WG]MCX9147754.1 prepilin peptidase [Erythrobacter sp. WG]